MQLRCSDTTPLCHVAYARVALPEVSIAHISGNRPLVLCQGVTCTALERDLWDVRITSWRVPPDFDPQRPRHPDEAVVVALVVEIQAFHSRPTCGRRPHNPLPIRGPRKMRGPVLLHWMK